MSSSTSSGRKQTISLKIVDSNDLPEVRPSVPRDRDESVFLTVRESSLTGDPNNVYSLWLLDNIFYDEDVDEDGLSQELQYSVALNDEYTNDLSKLNSLTFQNMIKVQEGRLYFKDYPNHEETEEGKVMIKAEDRKGGNIYQVITIGVEDVNDPPLIKSVSQLPLAGIKSWYEDEGPFREDLSKLVFDEDEFAWEEGGLEFEVISIVDEEGKF